MSEPEIIPILTINPRQLSVVYSKAVSSFSGNTGDVDTEQFAMAVLKHLNRKHFETLPTLTRACLLFMALNNHEERLLGAGLVARSAAEPDRLMVTGGLVAAASIIPLTTKIHSDSMEPVFSLDELIALAKDQEATPHTVKLTSLVQNMRPVDVPSSLLSNIFSGHDKNKTMGEILAEKVGFTGDINNLERHFKREDYPGYFEMMDRRKEMLASLPPGAAALFTGTEKPQERKASLSHVGAVMQMVGNMPPDVARTVMRIQGIGPWALQPLLDRSPQWSWPAYRDAILREPSLAALPCLHGCCAITYFARNGHAHEIRALIAKAPDAIEYHEASGRPVLADPIAKTGTDDVIRALLDAGADPNEVIDGTTSLMTHALRSANHSAVVSLFEHGYEYTDDPSIDRRTVQTYFVNSNPPVDARALLEEILPKLPEQSSFTQFLNNMEAALIGGPNNFVQ